MSNIKKIKAEIERLKNKNAEWRERINSEDGYSYESDVCCGYDEAIEDFESFIDSLPEEKPSEDLNKLIQKWDRIDINTVLKVKVKATGKVIDGFYDGRGHFDHFIDHDVFDRYSIDEVELMPDEEPSDELEEAAEKQINEALFKWSYDDEDGIEQYVHDAFIAGAGWQKGQMMKDAVEGFIICYNDDTYAVESCCLDNKEHHHPSGDKVKLIIVKQDDRQRD